MFIMLLYCHIIYWHIVCRVGFPQNWQLVATQTDCTIWWYLYHIVYEDHEVMSSLVQGSANCMSLAINIELVWLSLMVHSKFCKINSEMKFQMISDSVLITLYQYHMWNVKTLKQLLIVTFQLNYAHSSGVDSNHLVHWFMLSALWRNPSSTTIQIY